MKSENITPFRRLQKIAGNRYAKFYQLIKEVQVISATVEEKQLQHTGLTKVLTVTHATGSFSFPISNVSFSWEDQEIQDIFFSLLKIGAEKLSYSIKKRPLWFNGYTFKVQEKKKIRAIHHRERGYLITCDQLPGIELLKHREIDGSTISLLYNGYLYEVEGVPGIKDPIEAVLQQIKRDGISTIFQAAQIALPVHKAA